MKNLDIVHLNLGLNIPQGKRFIGFHEGPYSRTAQVAVPKEWSISAFIEHDDSEAARTYDERRRTIYCIAIHPDGKEAIIYKWRVGTRTNPIHLTEKDIEEISTIDPEKIISHISTAFGG